MTRYDDGIWGAVVLFLVGAAVLFIALAFAAPAQRDNRRDLGYTPTACQASVAHYRGLYHDMERRARKMERRVGRLGRDLTIARMRADHYASR